MALQGVLFDLDGTVANTLGDLAAATNATLAHFGFATRPEENFCRYVGNGARKQVERALGRPVPPETFEALYAWYLQYYNTHACLRTRPYDGLPAVLNALRQRGLRLGIVTNKPQPMADQIAHALYEGVFEVVYGAREDYPLKPDPASARLAMAALDLTPANTLFVGDSAVDVQTAHNAGLPCVGVAWGFRGRAELTAAGADQVIDSPAELLSIT